MSYVDGFVIPVPKKKLKDYVKLAQAAGKIWKEYGALDYRECALEDSNDKFGLPFPKLVKVKAGETVVFAWILYKSKAHRDRVNKKVMSDPRIAAMGDEKSMPFDGKRMSYGGFNVLVEY